MHNWAGEGHEYATAADYATWKARGYRAFTGVLGNHEPACFGGGYDCLAMTAAGQDPAGKYRAQMAYEGLAVPSINGGVTGLGLLRAKASDPTIEAFLGSFYLRTSSSASPPMGDWFDDNLWATSIVPWFTKMATCVGTVLGGDGAAFDAEPQENFENPYGGHTLADLRAKAEQRGFEIGTGMWGAFADMILAVYGWRPSGGWYDKLNPLGQNGTYPSDPPLVLDKFFHGILRGVATSGSANARLRFLDATFYKPSAGGAGSSRSAKLQLNIGGTFAQASKNLAQSTWDKVCDKLDVCPFDWASSDGHVSVTAPGTYDDQLLRDREYGMHVRGQYDYGHPGTPDANNGFTPYTNTDYFAGMQTAASSSAIVTTVPTIFAAAASASAGTVTVTCHAAHKYGIAHVRVYSGATFNAANPETSYLGAMVMDWKENGGSPSTNYDNAYQDCTYSTPGSSGNWLVLKATSSKDDVHWQTIQAS